MLIGLQLPSIVANLAPRTASELLGLGAAVSLTAIVARIVGLPRHLPAAPPQRSHPGPRSVPGPAAVFIVSWAGMRGAVSLAPRCPPARADFPERTSSSS